MALYDFKCVHQNCGHEFVVRMSMRENLAQSQDKFCKVECPMCLQNKPKRLIRPKTLLVDCFGTHHSGTFDSSDGRHPPEMDGVTFSNRREWTKKREAWGIASKGEVDPTDRGVAKFRAGEDLSQVSQIVMPQVIKALVVAKKPVDYCRRRPPGDRPEVPAAGRVEGRPVATPAWDVRAARLIRL
jgi:hypothetical protein